jgi:hypothetical protein
MNPQLFSTVGAVDPSKPATGACDNISYKIGNDPLLSFKPDNNIPLGIRMMAAIKNPDGGTGTTKTAYKARVYLDFALNREFGINHIAMYGNGVIAGDFVDSFGLPADGKAEQLSYSRTVTTKVNGTNIKNGEINQAKNKEKAEQLNMAVNGTKAPSADIGVITFTAGILFDIPNKTFHAEAEVFLKQGDLVGIGPNNRVGKAVIHFEPGGKWYIHAGQAAKNQRIGLRYGTTAQIDAYLMLGYGVPQFPRPDQEVIDFFPSLATKFNGPVCSNLSDGKAFALGASAKLQLGAEKGGFYAKGTAIAGLDILISNNAPCITAGSWLGQGQVYALFKAETGYKRFTLANLGLGIYGYVQAPKPFGMNADVCIAVPRWVDKDRVKCLSAKMGDDCPFTQVTTCANTN